MTTWLIVFVAVTAVAVIVQMLILLGLFLAVRKTTSRVDTLANELESRALPMLDSAQAMVADAEPKVKIITDNLAEISTSVHSQMDRVERTMSDAVDRARLQVIRADELMTRAMDQVEETAESVHTAVRGPVKRASGVMQGIAAGVGAYFGGVRQQSGRRGPHDEELFI